MAAGHYAISLAGQRTFIPSPLPAQLRLTEGAHGEIARAMHLLGQVETLATHTAEAEALGLPAYAARQREAVASSAIEGLYTTQEALLRYDATGRTGDAGTREVANYAAALEWGVSQLPALGLSAPLIHGLHARLMTGVQGLSTVGAYRESQNWIGPPGASPARATHVPPPPEQVPTLMAALERYLQQEGETPALARVALAHYQFETIHPFADGNGRVGRLLMLLHLLQTGLLSRPLVHPSRFFERTRPEYYRLLTDTRESSDWGLWVVYVVRGIAEQCRETLALVPLLRDVRMAVATQLAARELDPRSLASAQAVLETFFRVPLRTAADIVAATGLVLNTVNSALRLLTEAGLVREVTGQARNRAYVCTPIMDAVFADEG
jgi:Fic family protein